MQDHLKDLDLYPESNGKPLKGFRLGKHVKEGGDGKSNLCFRKIPQTTTWGMNWGRPESLWGEQQESSEKSRVVTGTGSHKCKIQ